MKKKSLGMILVLCLIVLLSGCGNAIPELTEEQHDLIVEYAVGTLLKYDKNHENRMIEISELEEIEEKSAAMEEALAKENIQQENKKAAEDNVQTVEEETKPKVIDNTRLSGALDVSIEEFLQEEELIFQYSGYEAVDEYPNHEQGDELFFVMNATPGKKLLVLKFQVNNTSGGDVALNMNQKGIRFKVSADGEERNVLTTMLLNDMAYYQGTIMSGESTELVLICEIPSEKAEGISAIELIMKNVDNTATISLN